LQLSTKNLGLISRIATKEINLFFSSPIAYLFLVTFAGVTLFVFFWGESFFSRNIADVRPVFEWMPVLLIFLASTLTMRLWSEEKRTGTLEYVLTLPVNLWVFVVGKFAGCVALLTISLLVTLPLPITVSIMGDLDWGPVFAGYFAALMLGSAYLSIGLFVSARSENQIVSLISAVAVCVLFYLLGSTIITDFFSNQASEWLRMLGTGSRFESITRGVIDLRDIYYYLTIIILFLILNTYALERERWANINQAPNHRIWNSLVILTVANVLCVNLWLGQINSLRVDTTEGSQYSISTATESYLKQLQEPLLIRGYFSNKTHPLLSPLVPQLRDLIKEYEITGKGKVRVEFIDPTNNPEIEEEANRSFSIEPVPFQVSDRYQSSIVSSYFNVLINYGNEYKVLGFRDLIEVKQHGEADIEVQLRNPEHDLTSAIKKVMHSYQAGGNLFDTLKNNLIFTAYISREDILHEKFISFKKIIEQVLNNKAGESDGRLEIKFVDPDTNGGEIAKKIAREYGFRPMSTGLFSNSSFYFYLTLSKSGTDNTQIVQIPIDKMTKDSFERNLNAAIKRFSSNFTKTIALVTPSEKKNISQYPQRFTGTEQFNQLEEFLGKDLNIKREDLNDGSISGDTDILLLMAPNSLGDKQLFAVDQFLMQGGTVIIATSPFSANFSNRSLIMQEQTSGLENWLAHNGLTIEKKLVMDQQNSAFPIPVARNIGGLQLQEIRMLDYPYFIDVRKEGLNQKNIITKNISQSTIAWASPININKNSGRKITELLRSSDKSWLSTSKNVMPSINKDGVSKYTSQGENSSHLLGVISTGRFDSYFSDKTSPLLTETAETTEKNNSKNVSKNSEDNKDKNNDLMTTSVISHSPESARIILFSSNDFLRDQVMHMESAANNSEYLNTAQLLNNAIDWSLEDAGLLSIRARGHFNRTLPPIGHNTRLTYEYSNYGLVVILLLLISVIQRWRKRSRHNLYRKLATNW
jgi:ABC-2 type transport system permease protein